MTVTGIKAFKVAVARGTEQMARLLEESREENLLIWENL
jgi:hypothetical protein